MRQTVAYDSGHILAILGILVAVAAVFIGGWIAFFIYLAQRAKSDLQEKKIPR